MLSLLTSTASLHFVGTQETQWAREQVPSAATWGSAWMGTNVPRTVFTVPRIPLIEIEMLEPETVADTTIDYNDDYDDDYDVEVEATSDTEHWLANDGRDIDMA